MVKRRLCQSVVWGAAALFVGPARAADESLSWLPPNAQPGECCAKVFVPPVYRTITEKMLLKESSERVEDIPAQYQWVEEKVVVKEASSRLENGSGRIAAGRKNGSGQAGRDGLEKRPGPIEKIDHAAGVIFCLVEIPAASPDTGSTILAYSQAGSVIQKTDVRGIRGQYVYDDLNRLQKKEEMIVKRVVFSVRPGKKEEGRRN